MPTTHTASTAPERFRPRDGDRRSYPIGILRVPAGTGTDTGFQYACDWQAHEWDAQECVVWYDGHDVSWALETTITAEYFGTARPPIEPKPGRWGKRTYDYIFFARAAHGELDVTFLPEYAAAYETRPVGEGKHLRDVDFGHMTWQGTHALSVESVWERDGKRSFDEHFYDVLVRGEKVGELTVGRREGFNGNTYHVAMRKALAEYREAVFGA